jgi:branched-chain amino acid transport system substrate-binding protein
MGTDILPHRSYTCHVKQGRGSISVRRLAVVAVTATVSAACSGGSTPSGSSIAPTATAAPVAERANLDGSFRIGVLLPTTGPGRALSEPMLLAIDMAVSDINAAGGLFGQGVTVYRRDEGSDAKSASSALAELAGTDRVDVIIGPASSRLARGMFSTIAERSLPTCSPAATAGSLSDSNDRGFFVRTMPSDDLEAAAMAQAIASTGGRSTAIVYPDDEFGVAMTARLREGLRQNGNTVLPPVAYDPAARTFDDVTARVFTDPMPDSVALIGVPEPGASVLAALRTVGGRQVQTVVNAGLRTNNLFASIPGGRPDILDTVRGVSPAAAPQRAAWAERFVAFSNGSSAVYAGYAYDCAVLLALAAHAGKGEDGNEIVQQLVPTSLGGTTCFEYAECAELLDDGRNIDLFGVSGPLDLAPNGDTSVGRYDVFTFDKTGRDISAATVLEVTV